MDRSVRDAQIDGLGPRTETGPNGLSIHVVLIQTNRAAIHADVLHEAGFVIWQAGHCDLLVGGAARMDEPFHYSQQRRFFI